MSEKNFKFVMNSINNLDDHTILLKIIRDKSNAAKTYVDAILSSTTTEVQSFLMVHLMQILNEHASLVDIAVRNKVIESYNSPTYCLKSTYERAKGVLNQDT